MPTPLDRALHSKVRNSCRSLRDYEQVTDVTQNLFLGKYTEQNHQNTVQGASNPSFIMQVSREWSLPWPPGQSGAAMSFQLKQIPPEVRKEVSTT